MPRESFRASAFSQARQMDLQDRGHGLIFVDHQPVNQKNYDIFTKALMTAYGVSRTAVHIRLNGLGLLNDLREVQARHLGVLPTTSWSRAARMTRPRL
jgi:hypothetical protein